jgi:ribosomal protein L7/L12
MSGAQITITGTIQEVIAAAKMLEAGLAKSKDSSNVSPEVNAAIDAGDFVGAVKMYREQTGCLLVEAKNFIEEIPGARARIQAAMRAKGQLNQ